MKPSAIKKDLVKKTKTAVAIAQPEVYDEFQEALDQYYGEFSPRLYIRTYQLKNSLRRSPIRPIGNGHEADVYYNPAGLNYVMGHVLLRNGEYGWNTWSGVEVFESAAHGSHGGYKSGTAIWDEPYAVINATARSILAKACRAAGIPI